MKVHVDGCSRGVVAATDEGMSGNIVVFVIVAMLGGGGGLVAREAINIHQQVHIQS